MAVDYAVNWLLQDVEMPPVVAFIKMSSPQLRLVCLIRGDMKHSCMTSVSDSYQPTHFSPFLSIWPVNVTCSVMFYVMQA